MIYLTKQQKLWMVLLIGILALLALGVALSPSLVTAQEPEGEKPDASELIDREALTAFEVYSPTFRVINIQPFDLQVVKTANTSAIVSGQTVTFFISIKNNSLTNPAIGAIFYDDFPSQMSQVSYQFSVQNVVSNNQSKPSWLFLDPIGTGQTVMVTVTGRIDSIPSVNVLNTAIISTFTAGVDTNSSNNTSDVGIAVTGSNPQAVGPLYFPFLFKNPRPPEFVLIHYENFEGEDPWIEFNSNGCETENRNSQYWVTVDSTDRECLPPARDAGKPNSPYVKYGVFEIAGYHSEGESDASYGIFINGAGGNEYYLFRIWPNDNCSDGGRWQLIRRYEDNGDNEEEVLIPGSCNSAINEGYGSGATNVLRISHTSDRRLTVYANGVQLGSVVEDPSEHLDDGNSVGLYVRSEDRQVLMKFDEFKVFAAP